MDTRTATVNTRELEIAADIQTKLLPSQLPSIPGIQLSAAYQPAQHVGGDYYDVIPISADYLGLAVADVSGKGIPACLIMSNLRTLLRHIARETISPTETVIKLNRSLTADLKRGLFASLFYGVIHIPTKRFTFCSAGHDPVIVYRAAEHNIELYNPNGIALALSPPPFFESRLGEDNIALDAGDVILLYTDGLTEAMNSENATYSPTRLYAAYMKAATQSADDIGQALLDSVVDYRGDAPPNDDLTAIVAKIDPV